MSSESNVLRHGNELESAPVVKSITTTILDAPPSCIEFSPLGIDVFVVGTYELDTILTGPDIVEQAGDTQTQRRRGSLVLFRLKDDRLHLLQTVSTCSAVLDLHFSPYVEHTFAIATSTGTIEVYRLCLEGIPSIELVKSLEAFDPTVLILSLAWYNFEAQVKPTTLAVSLSDGTVAIVDYIQDRESIRCVRAHSLEAWTVTWSQKANNLWSGGDDSKLSLSSATFEAGGENPHREHASMSHAKICGTGLASDIADDDSLDPSKAKACVSMDVIQSDTKLHSAGVTAIIPIQLLKAEGTETFVTGSYDEYMRIVRPVQGRRCIVLGELHLGGGVWRLKMISEHTSCDASTSRWKILASCMHAGSRIVDVVCCYGSQRHEDDHWSFKILARFEEHKSMNYAGDSSPLGKIDQVDGKCVMIASTSFYDKRLCIWNLCDIKDPDRTKDFRSSRIDRLPTRK